MDYFTVTFLLLVPLAYGQHAGVGKCPAPPVQAEFQLAEYLGVWYEIARYEAVFELGSKCNTANYTMLPNGHIRVVNSGILESSGKVNQAIGEAFNPDPLVGSKLIVGFGNTTFQKTPNYLVVSTDYAQYSMVYSCQQFTSVLHFELAWILSRTPTISAELKDTIVSKYESLGIGTKPLHFTPQGEANGCTYPYVH